jgi:hypothetical protein
VIVTEEEAKQRMCPILARVGPYAESCIGSRCMMWQWFDVAGTSGQCGLAARGMRVEREGEKK